MSKHRYAVFPCYICNKNCNFAIQIYKALSYSKNCINTVPFKSMARKWPSPLSLSLIVANRHMRTCVHTHKHSHTRTRTQTHTDIHSVR